MQQLEYDVRLEEADCPASEVERYRGHDLTVACEIYRFWADKQMKVSMYERPVGDFTLTASSYADVDV